MMRSAMIRQSEYTSFLKSVPSFANLQEDTLIKIADVMEETAYKVIENKDRCYVVIIISNAMKITQNWKTKNVFVDGLKTK